MSFITPDSMEDGQPQSLLGRAYASAADHADDEDQTRLRLIDSAYEVFSRVGIQRSSMEDIARRAGVSRITLYRRFATKDLLIEEVILREFRRYFDKFITEMRAADTVADRVTRGFISSLQAIRVNPLIGGLIHREPSLVSSFVIGGEGQILAMVREFVSRQLAREQHAGNIPDSIDVELAAEMMVRISASFLTTPSQIVDLNNDLQLTVIAQQYLVPMITSSPLDNLKGADAVSGERTEVSPRAIEADQPS